MSAIFDRVLPLNLIANTAVFYVAARLYLLPLIPRVRPQQILVPILLLHSTRHLGMMFLTRGATYPGLPQEFAYRVLGSNGAEKWHREMLREQLSELQLLTSFHNIHRLTSVEGE